MPDLLEEPWFWPTVAVIVGLPIVLLVLTEVAAGMMRTGRHGVKLVPLVRNWVVPFGALLLLLTQTEADHGRRSTG